MNRIRAQYLLAVLAGAALPLAFAPFGQFWLAPLLYAVLLYVWRDATPRNAAGLGFAFGCASFGLGTYWTYIAVGEIGQAPIALAVFLTVGLTAVLAAFIALAGWAGARAFRTTGAVAWLATLPAMFVLTEWLRGWLFSGFGWLAAGYTVGAIVALVLVGRFVLNPMFRLIGRLGERELFIVAGLFTVVASAALMHALGLSVALGAFVAGVMLAESPYRHELESDVEPFRSILLGLFFLSVGMTLNLATIAERPALVVGIALGVIAIKCLIIAGLARAFGNNWPRSVRLGLLLSQAGEFGFVLFPQATTAGLILPEAASLFGAVVTLSMAR